MTRILALAGDVSALIADIRLRTPLQALTAETGWSLKLRSFHECRRSDVAAADVMAVQRGASARAWRLQQAMRLRGGAVIYEVDDLITDLPPHVSNQQAMHGCRDWVRRCLAMADAVTVSTRRLGDELGLPQALLVPNHAWPASDVPLPTFDPGQPVTLLIASMECMASHFIHPALLALQGPGLDIVVMGPPGAAFEAAGIRVQRHSLMPRADFMTLARNLPNAVAVIPLESSRFAACKSAIKWFEYAELGVPVLCSDVSPYREVVQHDQTGWLVPNTAADWQAALQNAIDNPPARRALAISARERVRQHHTLAQTATAWQVAVQHALAARQAAGPLSPTLSWRVSDAMGGAVDELTCQLRERNRARLARRRRG